jgi:ketosteroid isomerase-like protein
MSQTTAATTREVIDRFNEAFQSHAPDLLDDLLAEDCVLENSQPRPDGERREGRAACLEVWHALAADRATRFELEEVFVADERATIRWRFRWGPDLAESVRGVNLMRVRDGRIVEGMGYVKGGG